MAELRAGVDTGGTFTDAVAADGRGGFRVHKRPTTPERPEQAVLEALAALHPPPAAVELVHGTTHATNALLTGRLGRTAVVTTRGFRDLLAIGRQDRERVYALEPRPRRPPQPRERILEARERLAASGEVVEVLEEEEVRRLVGELRALEPEAVAVGLLHAWRNPVHEERLGRALREAGFAVRLASELAPEQREYERLCTVWADAALLPVVGPALGRLEEGLKSRWGEGARLRVMRSDGGTAAGAAAAADPVNLALSGPAGGLAAARSLADARGDGAILTLDMGGTSTDVALLEAGALPLGPLELAGIPLLVRGLPIHSVGTGGGSLAGRDLGGALTVGPDSAGAVPGPACYGRGGTQATVTDAHLLCGRLHPGLFLGGGFPLDEEAAREALAGLGGAPGERAREVLEIASAGMERALRRVSLARGRDPRGLVLYAFGGAGGLHAAWLAERMGMPRVVLPPHPGAFSALGLLAAPPRRVRVRGLARPLPPATEREGLWAPLIEAARAGLEAEGIPAAEIQVRRLCELQGRGQAGRIALEEGPDLEERFHAEHERRFGYARRDEPVLLMVLRVEADGPLRGGWPRREEVPYEARPRDRRPAVLPEAGWAGETPWFLREELEPGAVLTGPALVAEYSATAVVPPGWRARAGAFGELVLERRGGSA